MEKRRMTRDGRATPASKRQARPAAAPPAEPKRAAQDSREEAPVAARPARSPESATRRRKVAPRPPVESQVRFPEAAAAAEPASAPSFEMLPRRLPDHGASIPDAELERFSHGQHRRLWEILGAHQAKRGTERGVRFAVWAPNAERVSVIGDFNRWNAGAHPMARRGDSGVWELFVPALGAGELYKYQVVGWQGVEGEKCDPVGFYAELRPKSASVVCPLDGYEWSDFEWMATRGQRQALDRPILIYEVHPGSWRRIGAGEVDRFLTWRELAEQLVPYVKDLGYTHLELLPISEHPLDRSWGYQTIGYFAPTSRFGSADDFRYFVDQAHQAGIGVILDWVPAHFPRDGHGLGFFDGTHLYEHADPRQGAHQEWGTLIFNYGRPQVSDFLLSSAAYWLEQFHVDGLRVDAVASMLYLNYARKEGEWIANRYGGVENIEAIHFLRDVNDLVHHRYPGVLTIAEESTAWPGVTRPTHLGGLGFDLKWNLGWMHDNLAYLKLDPIHRRFHQDRITFSIWYAWHEKYLLPLSHDEVVHGKAALVAKMPGDRWQRFATLRTLYAHMAAHPGKKLLFMGGELAQWSEWGEARSLEWNMLDHEPHQGVHRLVRDLNHLVADQPALHEIDFETHGFRWIDFRDVEQSVTAYLRFAKDPSDFVMVANNYTPVPRHGYRLGVPEPGRYTEILNTDAHEYGGSGVRNGGTVESEPIEFHGYGHSIAVTLPPLGSVWFKREG